jgi:hypothetical protein
VKEGGVSEKRDKLAAICRAQENQQSRTQNFPVLTKMTYPLPTVVDFEKEDVLPIRADRAGL